MGKFWLMVCCLMLCLLVVASTTTAQQSTPWPLLPVTLATPTPTVPDEPPVVEHPPWLRVRLNAGVSVPTAGYWSPMLRLSEQVDLELPDFGPILLGLGLVQEIGTVWVQRTHLRVGLRSQIGVERVWSNETTFDAAIILNAGLSFGRINSGIDYLDGDFGGTMSLRARMPELEISFDLGFATIQSIAFPFASIGFGWTFGAYRD